jgi:hypothetical protein
MKPFFAYVLLDEKGLPFGRDTYNARTDAQIGLWGFSEEDAKRYRIVKARVEAVENGR